MCTFLDHVLYIPLGIITLKRFYIFNYLYCSYVLVETSTMVFYFLGKVPVRYNLDLITRHTTLQRGL